MDPVGTLIGLAEVSLALAGFAAVVLVLDTRGSSLEPQHAANVRTMVLNAVGSAFFCLFCVAILSLEVAIPFAWRLMSALGLVALVAASVMNQLLFLRHLTPDPLMATIWWSFAIMAGGIQLANVLGFLGPPSFGLMFLGLVVVLSQAGAQFVQMVYALIGRSAA